MQIFQAAGSHTQVGLAVGKAFKSQIARTLALNDSLQRQVLPYHQSAHGQKRYERLLRMHQQYCPDHMAELEALAQGADQPFDRLFLVNMRGEYWGYLREQRHTGCSTCSLCNDQVAVFGHNEDGLPLYDGATYLLELRVTGKPRMAAFCYPGFLPGNAFGFNSEGICFSVNNIRPHGLVEGLGRHFIARSLLEARDLEDALERVAPARRASGFNYTIASIRERRIFNVEVTPLKASVTEIKGPFFHANHVMILTGVAQSISASSRSRQRRADDLIGQGLVNSAEEVLRLLGDRHHPTYPLQRNGAAPDQLATLVTALFDLDAKQLRLYDLRPQGTDGPFNPLTTLALDLD